MPTAKKRTRLKRPTQPMPAMVRAALTRSGLMATYRARPPYQRNDWLAWVNRAAREETKVKRLREMLSDLRRGDVYMGMTWRKKKKRS